MAEEDLKDIQAGERFDIAVLPLQQTTLFPETIIPLTVGRPRSIRAVEAALASEEKLIACVTIKTEGITGQEAKPTDLFEVGTLVNVKRMMRTEDNTLQLIVQGTERVRVVSWNQEEPFLQAKVEVLPDLAVRNHDEVEAFPKVVRHIRRPSPGTQQPGAAQKGSCLQKIPSAHASLSFWSSDCFCMWTSAASSVRFPMGGHIHTCACRFGFSVSDPSSFSA